MTEITIIPAIDIKGGRCVRLRQLGWSTVTSRSPNAWLVAWLLTKRSTISATTACQLSTRPVSRGGTTG